MTSTEIWTYQEQALASLDLTGFGVEAVDGSIGKVDEANDDVGSSYIVVDTGPWIFGKTVLLPAGVISRVDTDAETVYVNRTKAQIKDSPAFDADRYTNADYLSSLGIYCGEGGPGWHDW